MKHLKALLEGLGYQDVATYINSGNVIFISTKSRNIIRQEIEKALKKELQTDIPVLVKTAQELHKISKTIPSNWNNDKKHKTDVAYLFPEADTKHIINDLPINKDFIEIRYVKGALFWRVDRANYNKSRINKLISQRSYKFMTMRNVNTARYLGGILTLK